MLLRIGTFMQPNKLEEPFLGSTCDTVFEDFCLTVLIASCAPWPRASLANFPFYTERVA